MRVRRWISLAAIYALSALLALAAAEAVLRARAPRRDGYWIFPPGLRATVRTNAATQPGIEGEARFHVNSRGLRGDEPRAGAAYRILVLGGSATECLFLDQTEAWPQRVQERLAKREGPRVWVGNAGRSGMTSRDHRFQAELLLRQEPEIDALVIMAGVNDLTIRLLQDESYDPRYLEDPRNRERQVLHAFTLTPESRPAAWRPVLWQALLGPAPALGSRHAPEQYAVWRRRRRQAATVRETLPDLSPALVEYAGNLQRVAEACRSRSVRLVMLTHPTLWRGELPPDEADLLWFGGVGDFMRRDVSTYYSVAALARGMALYNEALLAVCRAAGGECIDTAALLAGGRGLFYDDCHLTERGAERLADVVADHLASRPPGW